jgi:DNA-directed RNA polymerase specialized sigma subunit
VSSDHIDRTHLVAGIRDLDRRRQLIARCALDEIDMEILTLRHIKFKPFGYIADVVGLSVSQVGRRYKRALEALADTVKRE